MLYGMKRGVLALLLWVGGCSADLGDLGDVPTPPGKVGEVVGKLPRSGANNGTSPDPVVSIMSHTSGIITIWATTPNNWLWGYSPFDSKSFGDLRNWYLLENANGSVSFRNVATNTCISAHNSSGIVHFPCDDQSLAQQFDLLPLTNRAVAIKSASNGQCLSTPLFRSTLYMALVFSPCIQQGELTKEQQWFIAPPIQQALPIATKR